MHDRWEFPSVCINVVEGSMIIFVIVLVVFWIGLAIASRIIKPRHDGDTDAKNAKRVTSIASKACLALAGVFLLLSSFRVVEKGHVGVQEVFGKIDMNHPLSPGLHMVNPLVHLTQMSDQVDTYTMSAVSDEGQKQGDDAIEVLSSDGLLIKLELSVPYRLVGADAPWVLQNIGDKEAYVEKIVRPAIRTGSREAAAKFTANQSFSTKRDELAVMMQERINSHIINLLSRYPDFKGTAFATYDVMLRNVELPKTVKDAIESKLAADQEQQKMEFVLQKETKEAERKRIEAAGIRDFQATVSQGISENLLKWKGIEATEKLAQSSNAKVVIVGGKDGLPLILNAGN